MRLSSLQKEVALASKEYSEISITGVDDFNYTRVIANTFSLLVKIGELENGGCSREEILPIIGAARQKVRASPFIRRVQDWPRGYPGDFETIEYIMNPENRAEPGSVGFLLEKYALSAPAAQQHRHKVARQKALIAEYCTADGAKILSLGCGSCPDVRKVKEETDISNCEFFFVDCDKDALAFSQRELNGFARNCTFIQGNVLRIVKKLADHSPFDLVIIGGLFDYFNDKAVKFILNIVRDSLVREGGKIFFTNISEFNIDRLWMEYLADWVLIPRTQEDLASLCRESGARDQQVDITRENTGMTYLVELVC